MATFVRGIDLVKTHQVGPAEIAYALDNGVYAYNAATGQRIDAILDILIKPGNIWSMAAPTGNLNGQVSSFEKDRALTEKRLEWLCIDLEGFEAVTGKKACSGTQCHQDIEPKVKNQDKTKPALRGVEKKTAESYLQDIEIAVALAAECGQADEPRSTDYHQARWRELLKGKGIDGSRKRSFEAFRRGLPARLKEEDPNSNN